MGKAILISAWEMDSYIERYPKTLIIDVREREEYEESHFQHAVNMPYEEGQSWELPRNKEIVVYCNRGITSWKAAKEIAAYGYTVASLSGGIWEYRGRNLVFSK